MEFWSISIEIEFFGVWYCIDTVDKNIEKCIKNLKEYQMSDQITLKEHIEPFG